MKTFLVVPSLRLKRAAEGQPRTQTEESPPVLQIQPEEGRWPRGSLEMWNGWGRAGFSPKAQFWEGRKRV